MTGGRTVAVPGSKGGRGRVLRRLEVEDLAILDGLALEFGAGLNVLTGETGAGKSLLLDALQLALGGRGDPGLIAHGRRALRVSALFDVEAAPGVAARLSELGAPPDDGCVLLQREVAREGRGACRINGMLATAGALREIGAHLLTLAGQGEHHRFATGTAQTDYLDAVAAAHGLRAAVAAAHRDYREAADAAGGGADPRERRRRRDLLAFEAREIEDLATDPDEEERLAERRQVLASAQRLLAAAQAGVEGLWEGEGAVRDRLGAVQREVGAAARVDPALREVCALLDQAAAAVDEAGRALRRYGDGLVVDPAAVAAAEERWNRLQQAKRKYGATLADVLAYGRRASEELAAMDAAEGRAAALAAEREARAARLAAACARLHDARVRAAAELGAAVGRELAELGMAGARLGVEVVGRGGEGNGPPTAGSGGAEPPWTERGWDTVQFLWSANSGEPAQSLGRVASGGELARLLLALHALRAEGDDVPTLVFDEVDAGVGGRAAAAVAQRLQMLGLRRQVLCVTHLAVIAAAADRHFVIEKAERGGRTVTSVRTVEGEERTSEVARMLDGGRGATSRRHAEELLRQQQTGPSPGRGRAAP